MTAQLDLLDRGDGVVGSRPLIGVQTFDIGRLTTHAVPVAPGTFVAVSGLGPKGDSNGSGKTTFLAAVSVALADPQWRLDTNGGRLATGLLFRPQPAGVAEERYNPADHGYIVVVFGPGPEHDDAVTVWVRLSSRGTPHLEAGWYPGVQVIAEDGPPAARYEAADAIWRAIPASRRVSARRMREVLYGPAPKCMTYLDTPLRPAAPSLLSQQMTEMTPEAIGDSMIALTGMAERLEEERSQRSDVADHQVRLTQELQEDQTRTRLEDVDLAAVAARDRARAALADGQRNWRLHFARGYLDALDADVADEQAEQTARARLTAAQAEMAATSAAADELAARTDLDRSAEVAKQARNDARSAAREAHQQHTELATQLRGAETEKIKLRPASENWSGTPVADVEMVLAERRRAQTTAAGAVQVATERYETAEQTLAAAQAGRDPLTAAPLTALADAGILAAAVADRIGLDEGARSEWEPRLWPWRSAVAVPCADERTALDVLAVEGHAGTLLVPLDDPAVDPTPLPPGVHGDALLSGFLGRVATGARSLTGPERAEHVAVGVTVLGEFAAPFTGRDARIAAARERLDAAERTLADTDATARSADARVRLTEDDLDAARAAAGIAALDETITRLYEAVAEARDRVTSAEEEVERLEEVWLAADRLAQTHAAEVRALRQEAERLEEKADGLNTEVAAVVKARRDRQLDYWRNGWGEDRESAVEALHADTGSFDVSTKRLRNRAQEALRDASGAYLSVAAERDGVGEVAGIREKVADLDDDEPTVGQIDFETISRPLRLRLDAWQERDERTADTITRERAIRRAVLDELEVDVNGRAATLEALQEMIEGLVLTRLRQINTALDGLDRRRNGFGAELQIESVRPQGPADVWRWRVAPRWRRSSSGAMISYREVANGAQVKVFAVQLVLAALLAAEDADGRVLVLDELGNSLGDVNRKDVLVALRSVAEGQGVTILGTCQDSVLADAAEACGEIVWFTHAHADDAYNEPTRAWGFDKDGFRVALTAEWVRAGRPLV